MKISECEAAIKRGTEQFIEANDISYTSRVAMTDGFDFVLGKDDGSMVYFDAVLLGTYIEEDYYFQFPFHPEHPAITEQNREMYFSLKAFGEKIEMVELTQMNLGFNPLEVPMTHLKRRLPNQEVHIGASGLVESIYTLDQVLAVAATFHKADIVVAVNGEGYSHYLAVIDPSPRALGD
ncbi:hypothetical protein [Neptuniibacter sp. QD37_11]|uniref:hypothetical protein n=1 Tax=Neptuniibacter sp. QD37_11 TaxID=3398209 RepID=UPI0039F4B94C